PRALEPYPKSFIRHTTGPRANLYRRRQLTMSELVWDTVLYEKLGEVARITLNRPEKRNALDDRLIEEVHEALYEADLDEDIRVIIVTGAGPSFSAGHDLESPEPHREGGGR